MSELVKPFCEVPPESKDARIARLERELEAAISRLSEACSYREAVDMLRVHREAVVLFEVGEEFLRGYDHATTTLACRLPEAPK